MIIPSNNIQTNKYTAGGELAYIKSNTPYIGYYYELNDSYYTGQTYNINADQLIPVSKINTLNTNPKTALYNSLATTNAQPNTKIPSIVFYPSEADLSEGVVNRYFTKQNFGNSLIKEISEDTYNELDENSPYQKVSIKYYIYSQTTGAFDEKELNQATSQIPDIKVWLLG
jgi:hypothetical protein